MLSLGCPKTLVDSENILGKLIGSRYSLAANVADCDVALLNTCAFIEDAQKESVNRILELIQLKKEKRIRGLIVMGCLVQRFPRDLQAEFKQVDAFIGSGEYAKIPEIVERVVGGEKVFTVATPGYLATSAEARISLTPSHYRYVKISEGCDHICTFCSIPSFRGKHRSRTISDVVEEVKRLIDQGAKEIILTGQDTTYFGRDLEGKWLLPGLLRELDRLRGFDWIRVLYAYPSCIEPELMQVMSGSQRVCHYLDMPLQHASDRMLSAMKRGITKRRTIDLIHQFRSLVPDLAIRTTFIVGFPGETEEDFQELLAFMKDMQFERLGIFTYSREEGTPAAAMHNQVPEEIKQRRFEEAMLLQQEISRRNNQKWLGKTLKVLVEEHDSKTPTLWIGRSYMDAPEVDGNVFIHSSKPLQIGSFYPVSVTSTQEYDLVGRI
jgi:ribosomal protein S12 methylthiotransferase